jgi:hypothetical protein
MSDRKVIKIGPHRFAFTGPRAAEIKVGMKMSQEEAIALAQAAGAIPSAAPTLEQRVEQAKAALTPSGPDEVLREQAKSMEAKMRHARARLGGRPPDDPESVEARTAAARRALGMD